MRIFNGTKSQIDLPLTGDIRLSIAAHTPSKDFAPNNDFLALIVSTYDEHEIALIIGGPYELSMCSTIPACAPLMVQTLDEAVERFSPKKPEPIVEDKKKEEVVEEPIVKIPEETPVVEEKKEEKVEKVAEEVEAPKVTTKKKGNRKGKKE